MDNGKISPPEITLSHELEIVHTLCEDVPRPTWSPPAEIVDVIEFSRLNLKVRQIENVQEKSQYIYDRLKATCLGKFYTSHLKRYAIIRWGVILLWRKLYPIYLNLSANINIYLLDRTANKWRVLTKLSEFTKERDISNAKLDDAILVETPAPRVYPASDQGYLASPQEHYKFPEVFVVKVNHGMVYGGTNLTLFEDEVICHDLYDFERDYTSEELHGRTLIDPKTKRIRWLLHDMAPERIPVAASFVDACASNYAHWLTEVLPRIAEFCADQQFKDIPIVVNDGLHKNIMESLFLVGGQERKIITLPIGRAIQVDELYLTSVTGYVPFERRNNKLSGHSHGVFSPRAFELIRNQIASFAEKLPEQAWPEKIYVRRNSGVRKITNVAELEGQLFVRGYVVVEPEKFTFLQQYQLFRNAKEVISPTGAALSNAIFCKPGTHLGVLMAKHENMIYRYWLSMLAPLQINVSYVLGDIVENHDIGIHADSYVDTQNVFELLKSWQMK